MQGILSEAKGSVQSHAGGMLGPRAPAVYTGHAEPGGSWGGNGTSGGPQQLSRAWIRPTRAGDQSALGQPEPST